MDCTIKRAIAKTILNDRRSLTVALHDVLFGYRRRRMGPNPSPCHLQYGKVPRMTPLDAPPMLEDPMDFKARQLELLATHSARAGREHLRSPEADTSEQTLQFIPSYRVIVAKAKALGPLKMPPFEEK